MYAIFREGNSRGIGTGGWLLRFYVIGRDDQETEIDGADGARRFMAWLTDEANAVLAEVIETWLWQPPEADGLDPLAEPGGDIAGLRTEIGVLCHRAPQQPESVGREA